MTIRKAAGLVCVAGMCAALAFAGGEKSKTTAAQPAGQPAMELPPGMTPEMMQACMDAGTPGEKHAWLAKQAGTWNGTCKMWMAAGSSPMESVCVSTVKPVMDGRYIEVEMKGDMPGMGPFHGRGTYGFDNVSETFQSSWIDNHSTGMWFGRGALSPDGKELTWNYTFNCPITKQAKQMREVETFMGPNSKKLEMFGPDMVTGKEFKMMEIVFTRAGA